MSIWLNSGLIDEVYSSNLWHVPSDSTINLACMGYNTSVNLIAEFLVGELKINFGSMTGCYDHGQGFKSSGFTIFANTVVCI